MQRKDGLRGRTGHSRQKARPAGGWRRLGVELSWAGQSAGAEVVQAGWGQTAKPRVCPSDFLLRAKGGQYQCYLQRRSLPRPRHEHLKVVTDKETRFLRQQSEDADRKGNPHHDTEAALLVPKQQDPAAETGLRTERASQTRVLNGRPGPAGCPFCVVRSRRQDPRFLTPYKLCCHLLQSQPSSTALGCRPG